MFEPEKCLEMGNYKYSFSFIYLKTKQKQTNQKSSHNTVCVTYKAK